MRHLDAQFRAPVFLISKTLAYGEFLFNQTAIECSARREACDYSLYYQPFLQKVCIDTFFIKLVILVNYF